MIVTFTTEGPVGTIYVNANHIVRLAREDKEHARLYMSDGTSVVLQGTVEDAHKSWLRALTPQ